MCACPRVPFPTLCCAFECVCVCRPTQVQQAQSPSIQCEVSSGLGFRSHTEIHQPGCSGEDGTRRAELQGSNAGERLAARQASLPRTRRPFSAGQTVAAPAPGLRAWCFPGSTEVSSDTRCIGTCPGAGTTPAGWAPLQKACPSQEST